MISYRAIGRNIRYARMQVGLTQEKMAEICGMSLVHYGRLERGQRRISLEQLVLIADSLCLPLEHLLEGMTIENAITERHKRNGLGMIIDCLCAGCTDEARGMILNVCVLIAQRDKYRENK